MTRVVLLVAVLAAGALAAGCGGEDDDGLDAAGTDGETLTVTTNGETETGVIDDEELEAEVERAREDVETTLRELADATSRDDVEQALERGAERLDDAAARVEDAEASDDVRAARDDLAQALDELAADLRDRREEVESGDFEALLNIVQSLDSVQDVRRAIDELREEGLDVERLTP